MEISPDGQPTSVSSGPAHLPKSPTTFPTELVVESSSLDWIDPVDDRRTGRGVVRCWLSQEIS